MSLHARPLPVHIAGPHVASPLPGADRSTPTSDTPPDLPDDASASPPLPSDAPQASAAADARPETPPPDGSEMPWPWYRREPWLLVILAAFVPIAVGFVLPEQIHVLLLGASTLLVLLSVAMLIRQGPFRPHPRPDAFTRPERRTERRAERRPQTARVA